MAEPGANTGHEGGYCGLSFSWEWGMFLGDRGELLQFLFPSNEGRFKAVRPG